MRMEMLEALAQRSFLECLEAASGRDESLLFPV
jgi:hypothetical protein